MGFVRTHGGWGEPFKSMAGNWIKIEHATPDKPEVFQLADELGIDPDAALGKLIRFWMWCDNQLESCNALTVTNVTLDRITFTPGFSDALQKVGWMNRNGDVITVPNFDRHNGQTAKTRATTSKRVSKHRDSCNGASVTNVTVTPLPEKRREEKNIQTPLPPLESQTESQFASPDITTLKARINGLKPEWAKPAHWNHSEDRQLFEGTAGQMAELTDSDWTTLGRFLTAKGLDAKEFWRPNNRGMFVKCFPDVFSTAQRWAKTGRGAPSRTPVQQPPKQFVPIDRAALAEVFNNAKP